MPMQTVGAEVGMKPFRIVGVLFPDFLSMIVCVFLKLKLFFACTAHHTSFLAAQVEIAGVP